MSMKTIFDKYSFDILLKNKYIFKCDICAVYNFSTIGLPKSNEKQMFWYVVRQKDVKYGIVSHCLVLYI
jgi:hypothetical protein